MNMLFFFYDDDDDELKDYNFRAYVGADNSLEWIENSGFLLWTQEEIFIQTFVDIFPWFCWNLISITIFPAVLCKKKLNIFVF